MMQWVRKKLGLSSVECPPFQHCADLLSFISSILPPLVQPARRQNVRQPISLFFANPDTITSDLWSSSSNLETALPIWQSLFKVHIQGGKLISTPSSIFCCNWFPVASNIAKQICHKWQLLDLQKKWFLLLLPRFLASWSHPIGGSCGWFSVASIC